LKLKFKKLAQAVRKANQFDEDRLDFSFDELEGMNSIAALGIHAKDGGDGGSSSEGDGNDDSADSEGETDGDNESDSDSDNDTDGGSDSDDDDSSDSDDDGKSDNSGNDNGLSDAQAKALKEVMKWKTNAREYKNSLKEFTDVMGDVTPDQIKELIDAKKKSDISDLEKRQEYDRIIEATKEENGKIVQGLKDQLAEQGNTLKTQSDLIEELTIGRSFSDSTFVKERSVLPASIARREFSEYFDLVEGVAVAYDKPRGAAERTPLVDQNGANKAFEAAIEHLYTNHADSANLIRTPKKPGAGSKNNGSNGDSSGEGDNKPSEKNLVGRDRIQAALNANKG